MTSVNYFLILPKQHQHGADSLVYTSIPNIKKTENIKYKNILHKTTSFWWSSIQPLLSQSMALAAARFLSILPTPLPQLKT